MKKLLIVPVLLIMVLLLAGCGSKKYEKTCTLTTTIASMSNATVNMTFNIYKEDGSIKQDNIIEYSAANGQKIEVPSDSSEEEVIANFATFTGMSIQFEGNPTATNQNNYIKNGKVYITNTITYDNSTFSTVDDVVQDLIYSGATCK